jgi:hypothetical protein
MGAVIGTAVRRKEDARFLLGEEPCASIGSILVNDIPICEARDGAELDCVDLLKVSHRDAIELDIVRQRDQA